MNIQKNNIYNPYNLAIEICKFVYPPMGNRYKLQWENRLLPLFVECKVEGVSKDELLCKINDEFQTADIIFADNLYMSEFSNHFSIVKKPFILVSADSDNIAPYSDFNNKCLDLLNHPYLIKWFSTNVGISHPKLSPIPIGIAKNIPYIEHDSVNNVKYMAWSITHNIKYSKEVLYHFMNYDNNNLRNSFLEDKKEFMYTRMTIENSEKNLHEYKSIRKNVLSSLVSRGFDIQKDIVKPIVYFNEIRNYKMCLSLPGAGLDCYRTWECLYIGVVPIVLYTEGTRSLFEDLPIIVLSLEEFYNLTKERLYEEYIKVIKKVSNNEIKWEKLTLSYWVSEILREKYNYLFTLQSS